MEAMVRAIDPARASWCILRGGFFVGPGTRQDETVERLWAGSLKVPGDGSNWVSFVHVADYAAAVDIALHSPVTGIFNVNADPIRNGDYLDRLADAVGAPRPARDPDAPLPRSFRCSNAAARAALGWSPSRSLFPERGPA
jgi:nucleoside-diphosphate-sugar epimerase